MAKATSIALGMFLCLIAGCFPIELDVNDKGEVLIARQEGFFVYHPLTRKAAVVAGPSGGRPVFARFAPGGKDVLLIVKTGREQFRFDIAPLAGGPAKTVYRGQNTAYTLFSPDGAFLAITRMTDKKREGNPNDKIFELILLQPSTDSRQTLLEDVMVGFRWYRDADHLLLFRIHSVSKDNQITGELIALNVKSRNQTPIAAAVTTRNLCIELSPDNQRILFTAFMAGKPGAKLEIPNEGHFPEPKMYEWNAQTQSLRVFSETAQFARYSRSGKRVLLAHEPDVQHAQLMVADASGKEIATVATDGRLSVAGDLTLPGWLDENTVFYFANRAVYGSGGKAFSLMTVSADGTNVRNAQPALDKAVLQLAKDLPLTAPDEAKDAAGERPAGGDGIGLPGVQALPPGADLAAWFWPAAAAVVAGIVLVLVLLGLGIWHYGRTSKA